MLKQEVGLPIPNIPHAVSVTLPTWAATVAYEEGEEWVVQKITSGYPRFFIHSVIQELAKKIENKYGREGESAMLFPSRKAGNRCREFISSASGISVRSIRLLQLSTRPPENDEEISSTIESTVCAVFFPSEVFPSAKCYWQHSGEGISSRMGEYVLRELFGANSEVVEDPDLEYNKFVEQKFGRVLDLKFAHQAKNALRRRICGKVDKSHNQQEEMEKLRRGKNLSETDVYFYSSGMAAIFHAHNALLKTREPKKCVCFGFPYVDTRNILTKFGPGMLFYGMGDDNAIDELEKGLESGEVDVMALFCECPLNPLLKTPNLARLRQLADKYGFAIVVDETVGNFLNIHVMPYADIVCSLLTKVFSGDSNVMAGSLILNPLSAHYETLKKFFDEDYEDNFWAEDALYLERNSRDFVERSGKIDATSLLVVDLLEKSPLVSQVYYPKGSETQKYYDAVKTPNGGYGGLISCVFHEPKHAVAFFDAMDLYKGPSLGTNFTLACPYSILAHYSELDEIAKYGVDRNLVRISVGLEEPKELLAVLQRSLDLAAEK